MTCIGANWDTRHHKPQEIAKMSIIILVNCLIDIEYKIIYVDGIGHCIRWRYVVVVDDTYRRIPWFCERHSFSKTTHKSCLQIHCYHVFMFRISFLFSLSFDVVFVYKHANVVSFGSFMLRRLPSRFPFLAINFTWTLSFEENPDLQLLCMLYRFLFAIFVRKENDLPAMEMEYWHGKNRLWIWMRGIFFRRRMQFKYLVKTNIHIDSIYRRWVSYKKCNDFLTIWKERKLNTNWYFPIFFSITKDHHKMASGKLCILYVHIYQNIHYYKMLRFILQIEQLFVENRNF